MKWYLAGPIGLVKDDSDRQWRNEAKKHLDYIDPFEQEIIGGIAEEGGESPPDSECHVFCQCVPDYASDIVCFEYACHGIPPGYCRFGGPGSANAGDHSTGRSDLSSVARIT